MKNSLATIPNAEGTILIRLSQVTRWRIQPNTASNRLFDDEWFLIAISGATEDTIHVFGCEAKARAGLKRFGEWLNRGAVEELDLHRI